MSESHTPFGASTASPFGGASRSTNPFGATKPSNPFGTGQTTNVIGAMPFGNSESKGQTGSSSFGGTTTSVVGDFGASMSNPFGGASPLSKANPFGMCQTKNVFNAKPLGNSACGVQTGNSLFGGTATGVVEYQPASLGPYTSALESTSPFGSIADFAANSTPLLCQKPTTSVGWLGLTPGRTNSSESTSFEQIQPLFGNQFSGSIASTFGTSTPAFGSSPSSTLGTASAFNVSSTPIFNAPSILVSEAFRTPLFGSSPALSGNSKTAFGQSTPTFEASSTPAFGSPTFFGSGSATSPFAEKKSPALGSASTPIFGSSSSSPLRRKHDIFRAMASTNDANTGGNGQFRKLMSMSDMPIFKNKSPEELRWDHYQAGNRAGPKFICQETTTGIFGKSFPSSLFGMGGTSSSFGQPSTPFVSPPSCHGCILHSGIPSTTPVNNPFALGMSSPMGTGTSQSFNSAFESSCGTFGSHTPSLGIPSISQATAFSFGLDGSSFVEIGSSPSFASTFGSSSGKCGSYTPTLAISPASTPSFGLDGSSPLAIGSSSNSTTFSIGLDSPFVGIGSGPSFFPTFGSSSGKCDSYTPTLAISPASTPSFGLGSSSLLAIGSSSNSTTFSFGLDRSSFVGIGSGPSFSSTFGSSSGKCASYTPTLAASTPSFGFGSSSSLAIGNSSNLTSALGSSCGTFGSFMPPFSSCPASFFGDCSSSFLSSNPFGVSQTSGLFGTFTEPFVTSTASVGVSSTPAFGTIISGSTAPFCQSTKAAGLTQTPFSAIGILNTSLPGQTATSGTSRFASVGQWQAVDAATSNSKGLSSITGMGQNTSTQRPVVSAPVSNPFGSLPAMPSVSIGRGAGIRSPTQFGISNMPISGKSTQVRTISWLTSRNIMQRSMIRMQARRYHSKRDSPKISFFSDSEEMSNTKKVDGLYVPHENPRALFIHQLDRLTPAKETSTAGAFAGWKKQNGNWSDPVLEESGINSTLLTLKTDENIQLSKSLLDRNETNEDDIHEEDEYIGIAGHRAGQAGTTGEWVADVDALMPKLQHSYYYIEPRVQELATKEREEPGYCCRVKDFVVGRQGYGSVKFLGATDVRGLDLENIIQFNKCEVLVYMDESEKPVIGAGLNKPAEITLLNVKCIDKKTGQHYIQGPEVEKFEKRLKRKTEEQGAEFISYNAAKGEWKFHVKHFSRYSLDEFVTENAA